ncbi:hypothetical protein GGR58DRAFT_495067 [Xylaria digitata]|nr:hypothetical protein GGR58DRAFT_495067 [Xylaria digitata]
MYGLNSLRLWDNPPYRVPMWFKTIPLLRRAVALLRPPVESSTDLLVQGGHIAAMANRPNQKIEPMTGIYVAGLLECEDSRDRVYAIIPIVDWVPFEGKQILPDYEIDLFDLVLDILQRTGENMSLRYLATSKVLLYQFRDGLTSPRATRALFNRRRANTVESATWMTVEDVPHTSRCEQIFAGFQLRVENGRWKISIPWHKLGGQTPHPYGRNTITEFKGNWEVLDALNQPYHLATTDENQPLALLPPCTQPGDWIITDRDGRFLIVRERPDGRYRIMGEARVKWYIIHRHIADIGQTFKGFFDLEDALVFHLNQPYNSAFGHLHHLDSIVSWLENAVCYTEGSSYADMEIGLGLGMEYRIYLSPSTP